jgi:hypothetical protein
MNILKTIRHSYRNTIIIRLFIYCIYQQLKEIFESYLTPKGPKGVFLQKRSKSAISNSWSPNEFFFIFLHFQP